MVPERLPPIAWSVAKRVLRGEDPLAIAHALRVPAGVIAHWCGYAAEALGGTEPAQGTLAPDSQAPEGIARGQKPQAETEATPPAELVATLDAAGRVLTVNPAAAGRGGTAKRYPEDFHSSATADRIRRSGFAQASERGSWQAVERISTSAHGGFLAALTLISHRTAAGDPWGYTLHAKPATSSGRSDAHAIPLTRALGALYGAVGHDMANLLAVVAALAERAEQRVAGGELPTNDIDGVRSAVREAIWLARLPSLFRGALEASPDSVDLRRPLLLAMRLVRKLADRAASIEVVEHGVGPFHSWADPVLVLKLCLCALGRVACAGAGGAAIEVELRRGEGAAIDRVLLSVGSKGGSALDVIEPPGAGSAPDHSGSAAGLQRLEAWIPPSSELEEDAARMGGEWRETRGSVELELPAVSKRPRTRSGIGDLPLHGRVLLLEQDDFLRSMLGTSLRSGGFEVETARGAEEASAAVERSPAEPLVAILPAGLESPEGRALVRLVLERAHASGIVLIAGEGAARTGLRQELARNPRAMVLEKPFNSRELTEVVAGLLELLRGPGE